MLTITVDLLPLVSGLLSAVVDALGDFDFGSLS